MANPNILAATSVLGNSTVTSFILRSGLTLLTAPASGHVYRIIEESVALVATTVTADDSLKAFITYEDVS